MREKNAREVRKIKQQKQEAVEYLQSLLPVLDYLDSTTRLEMDLFRFRMGPARFAVPPDPEAIRKVIRAIEVEGTARDTKWFKGMWPMGRKPSGAKGRSDAAEGVWPLPRTIPKRDWNYAANLYTDGWLTLDESNAVRVADMKQAERRVRDGFVIHKPDIAFLEKYGHLLNDEARNTVSHDTLCLRRDWAQYDQFAWFRNTERTRQCLVPFKKLCRVLTAGKKNIRACEFALFPKTETHPPYVVLFHKGEPFAWCADSALTKNPVLGV